MPMMRHAFGIRSRLRLWLGGLLLPWAWIILSCRTAHALSCSFSISNVTFGSVDGLAGTSVDTTATLSASCTGGLQGQTIRICPNIGAGSGGGSAVARQMTSGSTTLNYQLYRDAARSAVWGSINPGGFGSPPTVDLTLGGTGSGSTSRTLYARLAAGPSTPGAYQSAFSGGQTGFFYAPLLNLGGCDGVTLLAPTDYPSFMVSATVVPSCRVSAQDLDFGQTSGLTAAIDAASALTVTCTTGTTYTIGLGGGNAATGPAMRKLASGSAQITYGLYRDAARLQPWGSTTGTLAGGTGTGSPQSLTVYGRVPAQATPAQGAYVDTVVVTVTY